MAKQSENYTKFQWYEELCRRTIAKEFNIQVEQVKSFENSNKIKGLGFPEQAPPEHALDLAWEIENDISKTLYVADCKYHKRRVDQTYVYRIAGVLNNIGFHKAMLISPTGFTDGAFRAAESTNVTLLVVEPTKEAEGVIRGTRTEMQVQFVQIEESGHALYSSRAVYKSFPFRAEGTSTPALKVLASTENKAMSGGYSTKAISGGYMTKAVGASPVTFTKGYPSGANIHPPPGTFSTKSAGFGSRLR